MRFAQPSHQFVVDLRDCPDFHMMHVAFRGGLDDLLDPW